MRLTVFVLAVSALAGKPQTSAAEPADSTKYWVFFADKDVNSENGLLLPAVRISDLARDRRLLRGWHHDANQTLDAPVSVSYLQALSDVGVTPMVESRWLNAVSVFMTDDERQKIQSLPFVRAIRLVADATRNAPLLTPTSVLHNAMRAGASSLLVRTNAGAQVDYGPSFAQLNLVKAIPPLEMGINGTGVRLGIIDTEFGDFQHPAFSTLISEGRLVEYRNFAGQPQSDRHGRHVASIMVGYADGSLVGPAHGAELLAATTEFVPSETNQEEDHFVAALEWMEAAGVDVVNVSLSYTTFDPGQNSYTTADMNGDVGVTTIASDIAASLGVVVVAAAGNDGCSDPSLCWYYVGTPADGDSVIAVGGTFSSGNRVSSSSRGPTQDGRIKPDVAAMGAGVWLAGNNFGYQSGSGTSFASPMVAAIACQILQVNPTLSPMVVRDILRQTASQANSPDNDLGWGVVDAEAAVELARVHVAIDAEQPIENTVVNAYPNPFVDVVRFSVTASDYSPARLRVHDVLGREVAVPFDGSLLPGLNHFAWHNSSLAAGVYVYTLAVGSQTFSGLLTRR